MDITDEVARIVETLEADCLVAVGEGSTIDLGKALVLRTYLPQITIPNTYSGSEATAINGETGEDRSWIQVSPMAFPKVIIYDVDLTLTLPVKMSVTSGMNAIAHAVDALYSKDTNPVTYLLAQEGIKRITSALPVIVREQDEGVLLKARSDLLYGAWACGTCYDTIEMSLHHKLCDTLSSMFNLSHDETHAVILPHVIAYNAPFAATAVAKVASSLGVANAAQGIYYLANRLGVPCTLKELGMKEEILEKVADIAVDLESPCRNPAPLEKDKLLKLLRDAWAGNRPE